MHVVMIGSGYVGLVTGACFADFGHVVTCVDKDADKIRLLGDGVLPIYEPGLDSLVAQNVRAGRLRFSTDTGAAVAEADAAFISVGTPSRADDGHADLSAVYAVAEQMAPHLSGFTVVVTKSTVPVGTGDRIEAIIREHRPEADVAVVSNPEFLREGAAIRDFKRPDRVVVGLDDKRARPISEAELYRPLRCEQHADPVYRAAHLGVDQIRGERLPRHEGDLHQRDGRPLRSARCRRGGGGAREIGLDDRIGSGNFLHAGPGIPADPAFKKDALALARIAAVAGSLPLTLRSRPP